MNDFESAIDSALAIALERCERIERLREERALELGVTQERLTELLAMAGALDDVEPLLAPDDWRTAFTERLSWYHGAAQEMHGRFVRGGFLDRLDLCDPGVESRIKDTRLLQFRSEWQPTHGALILGPTSVGKSTAAAIALIRAAVAYRKAKQKADGWRHNLDPTPVHLFVRAATLGGELEFGKIKNGQGSLVAKAISVPLLAIDDVGYEEPNQSAVIVEIIAARSGRGLSSIVTSGLVFDAFKRRYLVATIRRIMHPCGVRGMLIDVHPKEKK